jgi:hypothetical protein
MKPIFDKHGYQVKVGDKITYPDGLVGTVQQGYDFPNMPDDFYKAGDEYLYIDRADGKRLVKPKNTYADGFEIVRHI